MSKFPPKCSLINPEDYNNEGEELDTNIRVNTNQIFEEEKSQIN